MVERSEKDWLEKLRGLFSEGEVTTEDDSRGAYDLLVEAERAARLREAGTPLERYTYETLGLEPGLDRATLLPFAGRGESRELAVPGLLYEAGKALMTPGAAASGVPLSYEDVANLAGNVMGGGYAASTPIDGAVAGMAVKQKGGVFPPVNSGTLVAKAYGSDAPPSWSLTYEDYPKLERTLYKYAEALRGAGLDQDDAVLAVEKARRYLTTTAGTMEDPVRAGMLSGAIDTNPAVLRDYLVDAARISPTPYQNQFGDIEVTPALEDFTKKYDELMGFSARRAAAAGDDISTGRKIQRAALTSAGVPESLQNLSSVMKFDKTSEKSSYPPWLRTADPSSTLGRAVANNEFIYDVEPDHRLINFGGIADILAALPPNKRDNTAFHDLIARSSQKARSEREYTETLERAKAGKSVPKKWLTTGVQPVTDAQAGSWVRIVDPKMTQLEGDLMGHSVGGYSRRGSQYGVGTKGPEAILDGSAQVYSLRDSKGPKVTVEVERMRDGELRVSQVKGPNNKLPRASREDVFALFDTLGVSPSNVTKREWYGGDDGTILWAEEYRSYLDDLKNVPKIRVGGPIAIDDNNPAKRRRLL